MSQVETSTLASKESTADAKPASQSSDAEKRDSFDSMLSLSFATPLAGHARAEKIKQMSNNHVSARLPPNPCLLFLSPLHGSLF